MTGGSIRRRCAECLPCGHDIQLQDFRLGDGELCLIAHPRQDLLCPLLIAAPVDPRRTMAMGAGSCVNLAAFFELLAVRLIRQRELVDRRRSLLERGTGRDEQGDGSDGEVQGGDDGAAFHVRGVIGKE